MALTRDIAASYRGPGAVVRRLLAMGPREDRLLAFVMGFCVVAFIAQMPALARRAHLEGLELNMLMGGALLGTVILLPLALYLLAWLSGLVVRLFGTRAGHGGAGAGFGARLALFWALIASTPALLLHGLVAGLIGPGVEQTAVGALWFALFAWFWIAGLRVLGRSPDKEA